MTEEQIVEAWEKILKIGHAPIGDSWSVGGVVTTKLAKETLDMLNRQKAEIKREHEIVEAYAQAARTIELYLKDFCNKKLPYDEMIADASRKASAEIERLKDKIFVLENDLEKAENLNDALGNDIDIKLNHIYDLEEKLAKAKSEAVKEFAKFLVDNKIDVVDLTAEFLRRGESDA